MDDSLITLTPIGVVRSAVRERGAMPAGGVPAAVEVFPEYAPALVAIENNSHLIILAWLHQAPRDRLQVTGRNAPPEAPPRGVFGLRAQMRPNPIGCTPARLLAVDHAARYLTLDRLDFIDGTPVVDIKRYSPGLDSIFAARTSRDFAPPYPELRDDLVRQAVNFHGDWCAGAATAVVFLAEALADWGINNRHPALHVQVGRDGCLADALQGMTSATLGNGRLTVEDTAHVTLYYLPDGEVKEGRRFSPRLPAVLTADAIRDQPLKKLGLWYDVRRTDPQS